MTLGRRAASEAIGTAGLLAAIVGSGVMGDALASGNVAIALLANTLATASALVVLITAFGPISGAHFNPLVSAVAWRAGHLPRREVGIYMAAQCAGAVAGVVAAHLMFGLPALAFSHHARPGLAMGVSEAVATFGLLVAIVTVARNRPAAVPVIVAAYIGSAYWFTQSTSFANPAVTLARSLTDTFAGIRPADVPMFLGGQVCGAVTAHAFLGWLLPSARSEVVSMTRPLRVLFLCTGNSARSQMAEGLLRSLSQGRIDVHSAGTFPKPEIHPLAVATMRDRFHVDITGQSPKHLDRYVGQDFDYVITVCDRAAESCPIFPGAPERIHWSFPDPAADVGDEAEQRRAFERVANDIAGRLRLWLSLPAIATRFS